MNISIVYKNPTTCNILLKGKTILYYKINKLLMSFYNLIQFCIQSQLAGPLEIRLMQEESHPHSL